MKRRIAPLLFLTAGLIAWAVPPSQAHPLGNFTVNVYAEIAVGLDEVTVVYVIDMAEIPTFQLRDEIGESSVSIDSFAQDLARRATKGLEIRAGDQQLTLKTDAAHGSLREGTGGLSVFRLDARFSAALQDSTVTLSVTDNNLRERVGWREIVIRPVAGQGLVRSTAPSEGIRDGLRSYPRELLSSPPRATRARATTQPGGGIPNPDTPDNPRVASAEPFAGAFQSLVQRDLSLPAMALAIILAIVFGAAHALGPGHGKTIMASYLVGSRGGVRDAIAIGMVVSLMHTASVVTLGVVTITATRLFPPEAVYPWLSLVSAAVVLALGAWLVCTRLAGLRPATDAHRHGDSHGHGEHTHHPAHHHDQGHHPQGHTHELPKGMSALSRKGLLALAVSGGLLPSPSALVVLLGAIAIHRVAFGITLVAGFSVGLAGALTVVGILVLKTRDAVRRRLSTGIGRLLPLTSATAILLLGFFLTRNAITGLPL